MDGGRTLPDSKATPWLVLADLLPAVSFILL